MATVRLQENTAQQATAEAPPEGRKSIAEMIFIPAISDSEDLEDGSERSSQEVWVLDSKRYDVFKTEADKYDEAAKQLEEAKINLGKAKDEPSVASAKSELETAQTKMREVLAKGMGLSDTTLTPVPQGSHEKLIECYGYVNKRTFYVSAHDIKKVSDTKTRGNRKFRFPVSFFEPTGKNKYTFKIDNYITDSTDGKADDNNREVNDAKDEEAGKDKKNVITRAYDGLKADLNKEWKLLDNSGQLRSKHLVKVIAPSIASFLTDENYDIVDAKIKMFNEAANFSFQEYEKKQKEIIKFLSYGIKEEVSKDKVEEKTEEFTHFHWGKIQLLVHEIWRDSDSEFPSEFKNKYPEIPLEQETRKAIIKYIEKEPLPEATYDYGGGAQFMRYTANVGGKVNFDFSKGIANASFGASTQFSLAQAGAEFNRYFPDNKGTSLEFRATVFEECFESKLLGTGDNVFQDTAPMYAHNSSFPMPLALLNTTRQLSNIKNDSRGFKDLTSEIVIQVAGHADTTGGNSYNQNMGYRRANGVHAFFTNNNVQWLEFFKRGIWKDEERDLMELTIYMLKNHDSAAFDKVMNTKITDEGDFTSNILEKMMTAIFDYDYPAENIRSANLSSQIKGRVLLENFKIGGSLGIKKSDEALIEEYNQLLKKHLLRQVTDISEKDFRRFYIDTETHPILTYGEEILKTPLQGRIAANRTVTLNMWGVVRDNQEVEKDIKFGAARIKIHGQVSGFVGANIALSGAIELNTYKGVTQLVAKQKESDVVAKYEGDQIVPADDNHKNNPTSTVEAFDPNLTVSGEAFVGAKAEASLSAALEWQNPEKGPNFGLLASIGGLVSGSAGAGIEGEFKIGFDQRSKTFQIKMKASATWGLGGGGAWSLSIGVEQLYDFIILVYNKLEENDFNFVAIFENKYKSDQITETESNTNVFQVYEAWLHELWSNKEYGKAGAAALLGAGAVIAFSLLEDIDDLLRKFKEYKRDQEATKNLVNNIFADEKHNTLRFAPPRVKGRMLYQIVEHKYWDGADIWDGDLYKNCEKAAIILITTINHGREWQEVMEHLAIKNPDGKEYQVYDEAAKKNDPGNLLRAQEGSQFLRKLLNDIEDWNSVCNHVNQLPHLEEAWKLEPKNDKPYVPYRPY
ncbi:OmpA family protein [Cellulophaga sp. E6(2014)]|uniref:OmpA family protein n=1 Tax=Cellulophaga sp. E6(2014) TaxID=1495334 RepID=UPI00051CD56B|nr:OmpA family protein [Cellulophaga sp. E6(2014)]KGK29087.1 hypothetical protein EL45_17675 [Cellulophaga sp. E6(2014)]